MSTHYLVDAHGNPIPTAEILDVRESTGTSPLFGTYVIRVSDSLQIVQPTDVNDLLTKKHQAMLAFFAGFTRLVYDDFLNTLDIDFAHVPTKGSFGDRGVVALFPLTGEVQSVTIPLVGPAPAQAFLTWESFNYIDTDPVDGRVGRTYNEIPSVPMNVTAQVTFDNGVSWFPVTDQTILNIPLLSRGLNFKVRFNNPSAARVNLGEWALIY